MKLVPIVAYRENLEATVSLSGDTLTVDGKSLDLSGDWVKFEWAEDEDKGLFKSVNKVDGEVVVKILAYQPKEYKRAKSMGLLDAMEAPIYINDGDTISFPAYLKEVADNAYQAN